MERDARRPLQTHAGTQPRTLRRARCLLCAAFSAARRRVRRAPALPRPLRIDRRGFRAAITCSRPRGTRRATYNTATWRAAGGAGKPRCAAAPGRRSVGTACHGRRRCPGERSRVATARSCGCATTTVANLLQQRSVRQCSSVEPQRSPLQQRSVPQRSNLLQRSAILAAAQPTLLERSLARCNRPWIVAFCCSGCTALQTTWSLHSACHSTAAQPVATDRSALRNEQCCVEIVPSIKKDRRP
jgi:hypothetical protein